jgi:hypothetical protein
VVVVLHRTSSSNGAKLVDTQELAVEPPKIRDMAHSLKEDNSRCTVRKSRGLSVISFWAKQDAEREIIVICITQRTDKNTCKTRLEVGNLSSMEDSKILQHQSILMGLLNSLVELVLGPLVLVATHLKSLATMESIADLKVLLVTSCILNKILRTSQQE